MKVRVSDTDRASCQPDTNPLLGYNVINEVLVIRKVCKAFAVTFKLAQTVFKLIQTLGSDGDVGIVHPIR